MNKYLAALLVLLIIILSGIAGYLILQNQKLIIQTAGQTPSPTPLTSPSTEISSSQEVSKESPSPSPPPAQISAALTQNAIKTNVNAKNYQGLIPYMTTPKVFVLLQATECCGDQTPQEASDQMAYIDSGLPFDFNQESETIKNLKSKNSSLSDNYIGISIVNEQLIAFKLDNENHIFHIEMSASWKLYNQ